MTNYQKRRDEAAEQRVNLFIHKSEQAKEVKQDFFEAGYDQGFADALADVQPLIEAAELIKAEIDITNLSKDNIFVQLISALAHFKTLGGKGE